MKILKLVLPILIFIFAINVYAVDPCTTKEMERLRELANNVNFQYEYKIEGVDQDEKSFFQVYHIKIVNFTDDLKITYQDKDEKRSLTSNQTLLEDLEPGLMDFYIYSYTNNLCTDELLKKVTVRLPSYNPYYYFNREKCEKNPDFEYCQEFISDSDKNIDFSTIDELLESHQKEKNKEEIKKVVHEYRLYYIALGVIILVSISMVVIVVKRHKKNKL